MSTCTCDWEPIESAPTNGLRLILWGKLSRYPAAAHVGSSKNGKWYLQCNGQGLVIHEVTHWKPYPSKPANDNEPGTNRETSAA